MNPTLPTLLVSTVVVALTPRTPAQETIRSRRPVDVSVEGLGGAARRGAVRPGGSIRFEARRPTTSSTPFDCLESLADQATGACLTASSSPTLGMLYPYPGLDSVFVPPAFVGGGEDNRASAPWSTVAGGRDNHARGSNYAGSVPGYATVGGGGRNVAGGVACTVAGGEDNLASGRNLTYYGTYEDTGRATIGGGRGNIARGASATIGGGRLNSAQGPYCTIGGGRDNTAVGRGQPFYYGGCTVGGGSFNDASGPHGTIAGGRSNVVSAYYAAISGGFVNTAEGYGSTVGGGAFNTSSGRWSTVGGGGGRYFFTVLGNTASGDGATVGGGYLNKASGWRATVPGGYGNDARGNHSFAAGRRAKANHNGAFVWGDTQDVDKASSGPDQFNVYCRGGARLFTNAAFTTGVLLAPGASTWTMVSDRDAKENVEPVDARAVLDKVAELPVATWNYEAQDDSIRHMGPMAQDFHAAFGLGLGEKTIDTIDPNGVALAAIQGLNELVREKDAEIAELRAAGEALLARVERLEERMRR